MADESAMCENNAAGARGQVRYEVDDLSTDDLDRIGWSGSLLHIKSVAENLARGPGAVDYLCLRSPDGLPVAKAGIDYEQCPSAGTIWQVAVDPGLQGSGLGSQLISACEARIRSRGLHRARIGVDDGNDDALRLYLRLGYEPSGRWRDSWPAINLSGDEYLHEATGVDLEKPL